MLPWSGSRLPALFCRFKTTRKPDDREDGGDDGGGVACERDGYVAAMVVLFFCRLNTTRKPGDAKDGGDNMWP
jgi:hypothetical protein